MIMGYEDPVLMPTMDIYSTDLMKAYIAGVKDQYERGQEEYKDFMKTYSDFYSPIAADNEYYYNNTIGGANKLINDMYANGIDPFKSPEARAAISRYIASRPTGVLNAIKQSAENAKTYQENLGKMKSAGLYNPEFEAYRLNGRDLSNWSTAQNGMWQEQSPVLYQSPSDVISPLLKDLDNTVLNKGDVESMGYKYNDLYDYIGITPNLVAGVLSGNADAIWNNPSIQYDYAKFRAAVISLDPNANESDIQSAYFNRLSTSAAKNHMEAPRLNELRKMQLETNAAIARAREQSRINVNEHQLIKNIDLQFEKDKANLSGQTNGYSVLFKTLGTIDKNVLNNISKGNVQGKNPGITNLKTKSGNKLVVEISKDKYEALSKDNDSNTEVYKAKNGKYYRQATDKELQIAVSRNLSYNHNSDVNDNVISPTGGIYEGIKQSIPNSLITQINNLLLNSFNINRVYTHEYVNKKVASSAFTKSYRNSASAYTRNLFVRDLTSALNSFDVTNPKTRLTHYNQNFRAVSIGKIVDDNDVTHILVEVQNPNKMDLSMSKTDKNGKPTNAVAAQNTRFLYELGSYDAHGNFETDEVIAEVLDKLASNGIVGQKQSIPVN